jgi:FixJ family two-component response regulator
VRRPLLVAIVDDDESVREPLPDVLRLLGYDALAFSSADEFLRSNCLERVSGLILDVCMPGMTGPQLQAELLRRGMKIPVVFITAQRDDDLRADLLARGAIAVLYKPFSEADLRAALQSSFPDRGANGREEQ